MSVLCCCIENIKERLKERYPCEEVINTGEGILWSGHPVGYTPFECTSTITFKSGKTRKKKEVQNMLWTYCPFCGKELPKEAKDNASAKQQQDTQD